MTGLPDYNYPAFHAAEKRLREQGYEAHDSRGAKLEMLVARRMDLPIRPVEGWCHEKVQEPGYASYCPACSTDEGDYVWPCLRGAA